MHKRYQYNINQIKKILQHNNLTVAKADKSKAIVIIYKTIMGQKIHIYTRKQHNKAKQGSNRRLSKADTTNNAKMQGPNRQE